MLKNGVLGRAGGDRDEKAKVSYIHICVVCSIFYKFKFGNDMVCI